MFKRWDKTLDLSDVWNNGDVPALGKEIAKRIRCMYSARFVVDNPELREIINMFEDILTEDAIATSDYYCLEWVAEEFNLCMENLYNWGDEGKRLCIITV